MDETYKIIFDSAEDGILVADENNVVTLCNPAITRITGYQKEELIGKHMSEITLMLLPREKRESFSIEDFNKKLTRYQRTGSGDWLHKLHETTIRTSSGDIRRIEELNVPVKSDSGYITISYKRDITEKWLNETRLLENSRIYSELFRFAYDAIFIMNRNRFIDCNEKTLSIFGLEKKEDILEHSPSDFSPPYQPDGVSSKVRSEELIEKALSGEPQIFYWQHRKPDGSTFDTEVTLSRISLEREILLAIVRDVSFRKTTGELIKKLYQIVEQSPVSIVLTDTEGNIQYVNPWFSELTGYPKEEVLGKNPRILKTGETSKEEYEVLWNTIKSGKIWRGEFHNKKKNGELYWESATIAPIKDSNGKITNFIGIKEDITEIKKLQNQLALTQRIESIGTLTTGIAHDFNNILTAISGYTELVKMNLDKEDLIYNDVLAIEDSSRRASELIRQLLAFSRRQYINPKIINVNESIEAIVNILKRMIGEDIQIEKKLEREIDPILADPSQIDQILINLAVNARDAMENIETGKKCLAIETANVEIDDDYIYTHPGSYKGNFIRLSVTDNGRGIPPEIQNKIFDPFFTTKSREKGTGMGLSTVYGIVKQNRGFIYVYSEEGMGTTFKVYWPIVRNETFRKDEHFNENTSATGTERVMLVEDDTTVRGFAEKALVSLGYTVRSYSNGIDAFESLKRESDLPDIIITDIVMPGMNGLELYYSVKEINDDIPFLFTSGYTEDIPTVKQLNSGGDSTFLEKPYSITSLTRKIRRILENRKKK